MLSIRQFESMKFFNKRAKNCYNKALKEWLDNGWGYSMAAEEAYFETIIYIETNKKERKYRNKEKNNE